MNNLDECKENSEKRFNQIKNKIEQSEFFKDNEDKLSNLCIYATGSFARQEATDNSDLDIFLIEEGDVNGKNEITYKCGKLDEIKIFSEFIKVGYDCGLPPFSNDGEFLKIFKYNEHESQIGAPSDDHDNWFTARMLLILESKCLLNQERYNSLIEKIISFYFRDEKDDDFKPYFILNDILRFWRTLCLNYEVSRTQHKNWEKKNISLKFSRRLTVFATIAYIFSLNITSKPDIISMIKMSPLTRLSIAIEKLGDKNIKKIHKDFLDKYMKFLDIKEKSNTSGSDDKVKKELNELGRDPIFKELIYKVLLHKNIEQDLRLFLVS